MERGIEELVRSFWAALDQWLASYWAAPERGPVEGSPGLEPVLEHLSEDVEWDWALGPEVFRGRDELVRGAVDFFEMVDDWRIELEEVRVTGDDTAFGAMLVHITGRESGAPVQQRIYAAITARDGRIARIKDHTDRAAAEAAAGLVEEETT